jgi:hypothetical protein
MAVKTWSTGELLTNVDANTYAANAGLVFVKSQTIGSGVSTIVVSDAFSATYDTYRIIVAGGTTTVSQAFTMRLGSSTGSYYWGIQQTTYTTPTVQGFCASNVSEWQIGGATGTTPTALVDLLNPFLARPTVFRGVDTGGTSQARNWSGFHNVSTSYSAFTLIASSGSFTGGRITVYGYRKA